MRGKRNERILANWPRYRKVIDRKTHQNNIRCKKKTIDTKYGHKIGKLIFPQIQI